MKEGFEDKFMDFQSDLVSLCLELTGDSVEKLFIYCSIEDSGLFFNAFFKKGSKVVTHNQLGVEKETIIDFLRIGTKDLRYLKDLCNEYGTEIPTELKLCYDVATGQFSGEYQYNPVCPLESDLDSDDIFMQWVRKEREKLTSR